MIERLRVKRAELRAKLRTHGYNAMEHGVQPSRNTTKKKREEKEVKEKDDDVVEV